MRVRVGLVATFLPLYDVQYYALDSAGVGLVQDWIRGTAANLGFMIVQTTGTNGPLMKSSEDPTASRHPALRVRYLVPAP